MGRLHRGRVIIGDITADLLARGPMAGLILLKQLFQAFDMLLKTMRFHSFALIILAPEFFPSKNSPFRYADQIYNFCRLMITAGFGTSINPNCPQRWNVQVTFSFLLALPLWSVFVWSAVLLCQEFVKKVIT